METKVWEGFVLRVELQTLDKNGRPCEACNGAMWEHDWVFMDGHGFVIRCCFKPGGEIR